jgi:hypothetical protein
MSSKADPLVRDPRYPAYFPHGPKFQAMQEQDQEDAREQARLQKLLQPYMGGLKPPPQHEKPFVDPSLFPVGSSTRLYLEQQAGIVRADDAYRKKYANAQKAALAIQQLDNEEERKESGVGSHMRVPRALAYPPTRAFIHPDLLYTPGSPEHTRAIAAHEQQEVADQLARTRIDAARAEARDDTLRAAAARPRGPVARTQPRGAGAGAGTGAHATASTAVLKEFMNKGK